MSTIDNAAVTLVQAAANVVALANVDLVEHPDKNWPRAMEMECNRAFRALARIADTIGFELDSGEGA